MVKELFIDNNPTYQCEACGYIYQDKDWAEKCEAWCRKYHSCNLEIIQHGQPAEL